MNTTRLKLLYLEDDELDQEAFVRLVAEKQLPYELTIADTLADARAHLAQTQFDLVIADYHLPDGHSTKLFDEVKEPPFILLTGTLDEQLALRTLERGADDYLIKDPKGRYLEAVPFAVEKTLRRKHIRAREQHLARELAAELDAMNRLHQLSTRFLSQEDLPSLLDATLEAALAITGADKGNMQLLDEVHHTLGIAAQRGFDQPFLAHFSSVHAGLAACGNVLQTRRRVVVEDVEHSPLYDAPSRHAMLAADARAVIATPLLCRTGRLVGMLSVHFSAVPHTPSERQLRLLDLLARQVADFIEWTQTDAALRQAKAQLSRANEDLERTVQERTDTLRETVAELEHFSYSITHDMRAPLRAMRSYASLLLDRHSSALAPMAREFLQRISTAAERMDQLILDALDYSKAVREELPLTPLDPEALLRGMLESYPAFHPPHAQIQIQGPLPRVLANQAGLTQCLSNLLNNAVKFVHPGQLPHIRIWAEIVDSGKVIVDSPPVAKPSDPQPSTLNQQLVREPSGYQPSTLNPQLVRIFVEDNGIGIAPESQERIFDMFQRLSHDYEGTGIGLALVRKVAERMGGKVGVQSEPGNGSRFWLELRGV